MKKIIFYTMLLLLLAACSAKKNTATSRFWQGFTAHYNTYFNGIEAYKEGVEEQDKGNVDNFTQMLPVFPIANKNTYTLGSSSFDRAIEKSKKAIQLHSIKVKPEIDPKKPLTAAKKQYLKRTEFNPFLKNAWLLMGKSQFHKGLYIEAASTFAYIVRLYEAEPEVAQEARIWLARCYAGQNWFYDAEQVISDLKRNEQFPKLTKDLDATMADLLLRQERYQEALSYLRLSVKKAPNRLQKARLYFLLGQVEQFLGLREAAFSDLNKCIKLAPPYRMALSAQMLQTEVVPPSMRVEHLIKRLKGMTKSDKNKEYLAKIYYALGNVYLTRKDTTSAIGAYEKGRADNASNGLDKVALVLKLADLYWDKGRYEKAQACYNEALGGIDKQYKDYDEIAHRSKVLDKLVPYTTTIFVQDSLQDLVAMPEKARNEIIDKAIEALKRQEKAERKAKADSAAASRREENGDMGMPQPDVPTPRVVRGNKMWYFYNPMLVQQGKQDFKRLWGNRKNEDNWRRANKTVVATNDDNGGIDYAKLDSIEAEQDSLSRVESDSAAILSPENNPHNRAYYLKDLPFTPEQKKASDELIADALYHAGIIEKDDLEDFSLAAKTLLRLVRQYPTYENMEDAYYQLFLLYSRWGRPADADIYRQKMAVDYPESPITKRILDPDFMRLAKEGKQIEDSLYTATYDAYLRHDRNTVERNFERSTQHFKDGVNRPKFIFIHALSQIGHTDLSTIEKELNEIIEKYPKSDVSEPAGMIINGLKAGRTLGSGNFDLGSLWTRRMEVSDSIRSKQKANEQLKMERNVPFVFLIVYPKNTINDNVLLYNLAHFNFSGFYLRSFDLEKVVTTFKPNTKVDSMAVTKDKGQDEIIEYRIHGFGSYDEVHRYAQEVYADSALANVLKKAKVVLISERNLKLVPSVYSFAAYKKFFDKYYAPLKIDRSLPIDIPREGINTKYDNQPFIIYPKPIKGAKKDSVMERSKVQPIEKKEELEENEYTLPQDKTGTIDTDGEISVPIETKKPVKEEKKTIPVRKVNPLLPTKKKEESKKEEEGYPMTDKEKEEAKKKESKTNQQSTKTVPQKKEQQPVEDETGGWYPVE